MDKSYVVHKRDARSDGIYIGRPSKWGNPFKLNKDTVEERTRVIVQYTLYLLANKDLLKQVTPELQGKTLICWCYPKQCHGDVLAYLANGGSENILLERTLKLARDLGIPIDTSLL